MSLAKFNRSASGLRPRQASERARGDGSVGFSTPSQMFNDAGDPLLPALIDERFIERLSRLFTRNEKVKWE